MKTRHSLLFFFLIVIISSCGSDPEKTEPSAAPGNEIVVTKSQFENNGLETGKIEIRDFPVIVEASGRIDVPPENRALITTYADGFVKNTPLLVGDKVKKGQFLLSLSSPEYIRLQQDFVDAAEQLKYLKAEFERQETLYNEKITSEKNFLKAEADYRRNEAGYKALKKKLEMLNIKPQNALNGTIVESINIYAPIDGSISRIMIGQGEYVSVAQPLMEIINNDHLHVELDVFEKDVMKLKKDQLIYLRLDEVFEDSIEASVQLIGSTIDEESRTVRVHGHFKDEDLVKPVAGMFVQAKIVTETRAVRALPQTGFAEISEQAYALGLDSVIDQEYFFSRKKIKIGERSRNYVEILNATDFSEEDRFLTRGAFQLIVE